MPSHATDPHYLAYQYGTSEKLRIRQEAHRRYSEAPDDFLDWVLAILDPRPGQLVADIGCGPGIYHPLLAERDVRVVGLDVSFRMVEEARQQALAQALPLVAVQANAEQLPLATGVCQRAMANHMLYHVPDRRTALVEIRRILQPGGRAVLAANSADNGQRFAQLHAEAARELGYTPTDAGIGSRFSLDHLPLVQEIFPNARVHIRPDAFCFPTAQSALDYYATAQIDQIADKPADDSHHFQLLPLVEARIQAIIDAEGVFRVSKDAGCLVVDV